MNLGCVTGVSTTDLASMYMRGWALAMLVAFGSA